MQRAISRDTTPIHFHSQATRILPGHGTGLSAEAVNDNDYQERPSSLRMAITVLANVLGGGVLLASLFVLPQLVAGFFV